MFQRFILFNHVSFFVEDMKIQPTKIIRDGILVLGITVLIFLSFEGILRLVYPDKMTTYPEQTMKEDLAYEYNDGYIVSLKPHIKKVFMRSQSNGGEKIEWYTNKNRFRGQELRGHHDARIMVYGDSNVLARFSNLEETFPYKLEKYLREKTGKDIEVINAGVVGFGPDQSLIRFMQEADRYKPDIVIFHIFSDNDFGDIIRNRLFELDSTGELVTPGHWTKFLAFLSSLVSTKAVHKMAELISQRDGGEEEWQSKNQTIPKLFEVTEREYAVYKRRKPRTFSQFADHYDIDLALYPQSESAMTKINLMKAVLKKAKQFADSKHIQFMVLIQPSSKDLTTNFKPNYEEFGKYPEYTRNGLTSLIEKMCAENNIPQVNLFKVFLGHEPGHLFFKYDDDHWNDSGEDVAAQETANFISQHMLPVPKFISASVRAPL